MSFLQLDVSECSTRIYTKAAVRAIVLVVGRQYWANGNRLPAACPTPWFGSRPGGMPRARGRGPVRGGCGVGEWRSVFGGIRTESVNPWNP